MPRGACNRCQLDYALNPESRLRQACPRCGRLLRVVAGEAARAYTRPQPKTGPEETRPLRSPAPSPAPIRSRSTTWRSKIGGVMAFSLLAVALISWPQRPTRLLPAEVDRVARFPPRSPAEAALREARWYWAEAALQVKPEMEALAAREPQVAGTDEERRKLLMALDRNGFLRRARSAGARAAALARSADEHYQAALWLALIECDGGRHSAELRHARRLVALQPHNRLSFGALRRAAQCNHLPALQRQAESELEALEQSTRSPQPVPRPHPQSLSQAALAEARREHLRAREAVARQLEALEEWDPALTGVGDWKLWRGLMARDRGGILRRAQADALRAVALAQTPGQAYRATIQLASIECELGHHAAELEQARRLMVLQPTNPNSLIVLRRAEQCNRREPLERQSSSALAALDNPIHPRQP